MSFSAYLFSNLLLKYAPEDPISPLLIQDKYVTPIWLNLFFFRYYRSYPENTQKYTNFSNFRRKNISKVPLLYQNISFVNHRNVKENIGSKKWVKRNGKRKRGKGKGNQTIYLFYFTSRINLRYSRYIQ